MTYQYHELMEHIPQAYQETLTNQQEAWEVYHENDTFDRIGGELGWGYIREWQLKRMDRVRSRTIERMQITFLLDRDLPAFSYIASESDRID